MQCIARISLFVSLLSWPVISQATAIDVAQSDTFGCNSRADLLEVLAAGKMKDGVDLRETLKNADRVLRKKIDAGQCFSITRGQAAFIKPEWQDGQQDMFRGIAVMRTRNGRRFYTVIWSWKFWQNIPEYAEPP